MVNASPRVSEAESVPIVTPNVESSTPYELQDSPFQSREKYACLPTKLQSLLRSWMVLRWHLSRRVFSVPVPYLTSKFDVKVGDLLLTLPIVAGLLVVNALMASDRNVSSSGTPPSLTLLLVFFFAIRNNLVLLELTGISFDRALFYHKLFAYTTIGLSALHGLSYLLARHHGEEENKSSTAVTGTVTFAAMVLLYVLSLNVVRRNLFEFFMRVHWVLLVVVVIFAVVHGAAIALIGVVPWLIDLLFRLGYRSRIYKQGSALKKKDTKNAANREASNGMGVIASTQLSMTALPGSITRISFPRVRQDTGEVFDYHAGQYAFMCIPTISSLEWHPFTISSSPHEDMVTFHIKASGDWTEKLQAAVSKTENLSDEAPFDILLDGPYGSLSIDIETPGTYSHFVLFSGGIGVTPMRSIVNWLHYEHYSLNRSDVKHVRFVWSVATRDAIQALMDIKSPNADENFVRTDYFPHGLLRGTPTNSDDVFRSEIYLTQAEQDVEAAVDQQLGRCLKYRSRPDMSAILRSIGDEAKQDGKDRVAVLACGPMSMILDLTAVSLALSREMKIHFNVHHELFEL
ncbi:hypothetical protein PHYBOEH_003724 [Phytophthora boehmeriae]|uniref:FAD-binding FR-type domain-containing protein n=1 Tax=Phytophthora boehmeriae TaxID=109152 RepID=A0A8T1WQH6_9STRA|nr:hypothetical protein PHYBOEH_003724 [Phytophthora boehmeriae]